MAEAGGFPQVEFNDEYLFAERAHHLSEKKFLILRLHVLLCLAHRVNKFDDASYGVVLLPLPSVFGDSGDFHNVYVVLPPPRCLHSAPYVENV